MEKFRGVIRAILALAVVLTTCWLAYKSTISPEAFVGIAMFVIQFYFNGDNKKEEKKNENTG